MKKTISLMITLLIAVSACHKETDEEPRQEPYITSVKYSAKKTVDDKLWLTLTATVNPAGLQIVDAGFLMGHVSNGDKLHSSYGTIVPCEFQGNTVTYDGLAKGYLNPLSSDDGTYIKPYFVFEDGTEVYAQREYLYDGRNIENGPSSTPGATKERNVTTGEATNITYSSATLNASISGEFKGAKEVAKYGFYIGENQYQLDKYTAENLTGDSFELTEDYLIPESKYYYYAYVLCYDKTELKGELKSFTTLQKPKITSIKYSAKKTVDNTLWLTLTATVNPAGLQIVDAGFLMGHVSDGDKLHSSYGTIVPCEFQGNTVTYDGLAKDYLNPLSSDKGTYIIPYFVFEDGTEIYVKREYLYDGRNLEKQY